MGTTPSRLSISSQDGGCAAAGADGLPADAASGAGAKKGRCSVESTCSSSCGARHHSLDSAAHIQHSSSGGTLSTSSSNCQALSLGQGRASQGDTPPSSQHATPTRQLPPAAGAELAAAPESSVLGQGDAGGHHALAQQQQQQQQQQVPALPPRPPVAPSTGSDGSGSGSQALLLRSGSSGRRSASIEQQPGSGGSASTNSAASRQLSADGGAPQRLPSGPSSSHGSFEAPFGAGRASFSRDADAYHDLRRGSGSGTQPRLSSSGLARIDSGVPGTQEEPAATVPPPAGRLSSGLLAQHASRHSSASADGQGPRVRASMESVASKASSAHSARSSFAAEAQPEGGADVDQYGRPSFAAFESSLAGRGAVFEASLPADLAAMYRHLAVLLPQAPVPLVTVLQLWGMTDPHDAQETVQIFVMQGVLKVATLPDGATWLMVSPDHQAYIKAAHPDKVRGWHEAVLETYRRQVLAQRYMQQQQLLAAGDPAGAAMVPEDVAPCEYPNDGYSWLALTHHLLGAGQLNQVRALLTSPAWLEMKLHCYGVAVVVDDFRSYLSVANDHLVKAVLQAFQMSLSCCMERSHMPMMHQQLVLRLVAAAQADAAGQPAPPGRSSSENSSLAAAGAAAAAAPRLSCASVGSGAGSVASFARQQADFGREMRAWFEREYEAARPASRLLCAAAGGAPDAAQQQVPPHLLAYTASLRQAGGRERMALRGHLGPIRRVVITADGKDVLTASDDGGVQVWDMDIGDCVMQLRLPEPPAQPGAPPPAPPAPLTCLAVTPDGSCCLSGDGAGFLCCWNLRSGKLVQRVRAHNGRLNALALDRSGSHCLTGGEDSMARLWSLPAAAPGFNPAAPAPGAAAAAAASPGQGLVGTLALELELTGHGLRHLGTGAVLDVSISSDGVLGVSASDDFSLRVWDLDQKTCVKTCRGHSGWVVAVEFVGSSHTFVSASHDHTARVWDAWTGDCLATLSGHSARLNAVSASKDGRLLVTSSDDNTACVWDGMNYSLVSVLQGHTSWINQVAVTYNGARAVSVSADGTARLWDTRSGKELEVLQGHSEDVACVVLTSRGRFAVTGSLDGTAQVWDLSAQDIRCVDVHEGKVISLVAAPDGSHAASIGADGCLRLWDVASGAALSTRNGHQFSVPHSLLLADAGRRAFSSGGDRKLVAWDMASGAPTVCLARQQGSRTKCIHVSGDGSTAVVLLFDSSMAVYDTASGALRCELMRKGERDAQRVHSAGVNGVLLTRDGGCAISWSKDATARLWDTQSGECTLVLQGHSDSLHAAALCPDEELLATASFDCSVWLWHVGPAGRGSGACIKVLQHTEPVMRLAFSGSSGAAAAPKRLVTSCDTHALWLWDVQSGACVAALGEHKDSVTAVAFSPDGAWLASASLDRSVLVWEAATGRLAGVFVGDAAMACCCFTRRGASSRGGDAAAAEAQAAGGAVAPAAQALLRLNPSAGGLSLLAGDAAGHVHFIDSGI